MNEGFAFARIAAERYVRSLIWGMRKRSSAIDPILAKEAKSIIALALRHGPIEDLHAGVKFPRCAGQQGYSQLTNPQMKLLMKSPLNRMDKLLWLKTHAPAKYQIQVEFGAACTRPTGMNQNSEFG
jgi:hypothetical protein